MLPAFKSAYSTVLSFPKLPKASWLSLAALRQWLNKLDIKNAALAHLICRLVPAQCPFERHIHLFKNVSIYIPPLCKLNPFYEEVVGLRFRALCCLADRHDQDIQQYC